MIHFSHWFFYLFVFFYILHLVVEIGLDVLNLKEMEKHRDKIPHLFQNTFSLSDYQKSIAYTKAKTHFGWIKAAFGVLVLWSLILSGGFHHLDLWLAKYISADTLYHQVAYPFLIGGLFYGLGLPFGIYHQFVLEERFGFNKTKLKTFIGDQLKTILLSIIIGAPLLALIFKLVTWMGSMWWLGAWGALMGFQLLTAALFPVLLAPLFYKFTPLPTGELKDKIYRLAEKVKFKMAGIFTIDGSRRSTHSNAFFAGMGKARRIVLFDTLVENLTTPEIVAVLAHEMGHNVKKHIQRTLILSSITTLLGLFVLNLLLNWNPFFATFGVPETSLHVGFVLFGLLSGVFTFPFNPALKWLSRKHEYEADRFSVESNGDAESMKSSLIKLSKDNLSNLTPHPWYSFYHYSHPTTTERVIAINKI